MAESAFAAAWAALSYWRDKRGRKKEFEPLLSSTADFLENLKPEPHRPGVTHLKNRLIKISPDASKRVEVWAYLIGHWLEQTAGKKALSPMLELTDLGWPLASFGLGFWDKEAVYYRKDGRLHRLVQPFSRADAFECYGPFKPLTAPPTEPGGVSLALGSLVATRGLKAPPIWEMESLLGGIAGVTHTRTGHVHRQFPGDNLPEWFEAVEIKYQPEHTTTQQILHKFWQNFSASGDLIFYADPEQRAECLAAWHDFKATYPSWAIPHELELRPCNWFEPARANEQKKSLQSLRLLRELCSRLDLRSSHLATKLNAFAAGFGEDEDVVLLAARYGLDDGLTLALRTLRYFSSSAFQ